MPVLRGSYAKRELTVAARRSGYALLVTMIRTNRLDLRRSLWRFYADGFGTGFALVSHVPERDVVCSQNSAVCLAGRYNEIINGVGQWARSAFFAFLYDASLGFEIWVR